MTPRLLAFGMPKKKKRGKKGKKGDRRSTQSRRNRLRRVGLAPTNSSGSEARTDADLFGPGPVNPGEKDSLSSGEEFNREIERKIRERTRTPTRSRSASRSAPPKPPPRPKSRALVLKKEEDKQQKEGCRTARPFVNVMIGNKKKAAKLGQRRPQSGSERTQRTGITDNPEQPWDDAIPHAIRVWDRRLLSGKPFSDSTTSESDAESS